MKTKRFPTGEEYSHNIEGKRPSSIRFERATTYMAHLAILDTILLEGHTLVAALNEIRSITATGDKLPEFSSRYDMKMEKRRVDETSFA